MFIWHRNVGKRQLIDYALDTKDEALFKKLVMK
ncbi:IDEAL domain-containing protein [Bacillus cereus]